MSVKLMVAGGILLVIGAVLPFVIIIGILESTFSLNFVAAISSILGIVIGFIGIIDYYQNKDTNKF